MRTRTTAGFPASNPPPAGPSPPSHPNLFLSFHDFVVNTESRSRCARLRAISAWISSGVRWKYSSPRSVTAAAHTSAGVNALALRPAAGGLAGSGGRGAGTAGAA